MPEPENSALVVDFVNVLRKEGADIGFADLRFPDRLNQSNDLIDVPIEAFALLRTRFAGDNANVRDCYGVDLCRWIDAQPMATSAQYSMPTLG